MQLRTRHEVAYEIWCIHENDRIDNRPPEGIAVLVERLRERHPNLSDALIEQGLALFTENLAFELERRRASWRCWVWSRQTPQPGGKPDV